MNYGKTTLSIKQEKEKCSDEYRKFLAKNRNPGNAIPVHPRLPLEENLPKGTLISIFQKMIKNIDKEIKDYPYFVKDIYFKESRDSFSTIFKRNKNSRQHSLLTANEVIRFLKENKGFENNGLILFAGSFYKGTHKEIVSVPALLVEDDYFELLVVPARDTSKKRIFFGKRIFPEMTP